MEQELAGVFGEWQIAELIEYDELGVTQPVVRQAVRPFLDSFSFE